MRVTSLTRILVAGLALCALAACGGEDESAPSMAPSQPTTTAPETTTTTTTTAPTTTEPAPAPGPPFGTQPVSGAAVPGGTALLTAVRLGRHEGFDRVVFEFRPGASPGYRVRYVQPPIVEDGSGKRVAVAGDAYLSIRMEPASGFDLEGTSGQVYTGPVRIGGSGAGTDVVLEVVRTGDFEAVLTWVAGLEDRAPFRVIRLFGPPRIVVDVQTAG
jgi:hypothetical protein